MLHGNTLIENRIKQSLDTPNRYTGSLRERVSTLSPLREQVSIKSPLKSPQTSSAKSNSWLQKVFQFLFQLWIQFSKLTFEFFFHHKADRHFKASKVSFKNQQRKSK